MKRIIALLSLAFLAIIPASADITLSVDAGYLTTNTGTFLSDGGATPQNGDLVLLIASPSGVFGPTTGSEFVSGDNLILGSSNGSVVGAGAFSFSDNSPGGITGETYNVATFDLGYGATGDTATASSSIVAGDAIAIRWYSNFTLAQFEAGQTPTSGYYGTYTTLLTPDGGASWVLPSDGSLLELNNGLEFFTMADGGTQLDVEGEALTPVVSGQVAVPEPSTYALLATGLLFVAGMAARKKRLAVLTK